MSHRNDGAERWALRLLNKIVDCDRRNRDALPGSVVSHVKQARRILIKLQKRKQPKGRHQHDPSFCETRLSRNLAISQAAVEGFNLRVK